MRYYFRACIGFAQNHIDGTFGEERSGQFGQHQSAVRRGVAGFQYHGIACGQGRGDFPHRHQQRVVPRGNLADHAYWFAAYAGGQTGQILACGFAFQATRCACQKANLVGRGGDFFAGDEVF